MIVMSNIDLVEKSLELAKNSPTCKYKSVYALGGWLPWAIEQIKYYYINRKDLAYNRKPDRKRVIEGADEDTLLGDCVNYIKALLWGWRGDRNLPYGGAVYKSNGVPDTNEYGMITQYCYDVSTDFSKIEVGEFLQTDDHCGLYIGNGLAVECTPIWLDGIQITGVRNIAESADYPNRTWKRHGKLPWISYVDAKNGVYKEDGYYWLYKNGKKITKHGEAFVDGWHYIHSNGHVAISEDVYIDYERLGQPERKNENKWVRYDEHGDMVYGLSEKDGAIYWFDDVTGAMAKGEVTFTFAGIFDEVTGKLLNLDKYKEVDHV